MAFLAVAEATLAAITAAATKEMTFVLAVARARSLSPGAEAAWFDINFAECAAFATQAIVVVANKVVVVVLATVMLGEVVGSGGRVALEPERPVKARWRGGVARSRAGREEGSAWEDEESK